MLKAKGKIGIASMLALTIYVGSFPFMANAVQADQGSTRYVDVDGVEISESTTYSVESTEDFTVDGYEIIGYSEETTYIYSDTAYIIGYDDGTIRPDANITRAEAAQILYLLSTNLDRASDFSDVSEDAWYYGAVTSLAGAGIISGYNDGSFQPNNNITCAEFVALAVKFAEPTEQAYSTLNHWASNYIATADIMGYLRNFNDFQPDENITRAEAVSIINKAIDRSTGDLPDQSPYTDIDKNHWAYADIIAASSTDSEVDFSALNLQTIIVANENGTILEEITNAIGDYITAPAIVGYSFEGVNVVATYTVAVITSADTVTNNNDPTKTLTGATYTVTYDGNSGPGTILGTLPVDETTTAVLTT